MITDIVPDYKGTGQPFFKIQRNDNAQADFKFFNASEEDIIRASLNERASDNYFIQNFDTKTEAGMQELESVSSRYLHDGYVITAYRETTKGSGQFYTIFEKASEKAIELEQELIAT